MILERILVIKNCLFTEIILSIKIQIKKIFSYLVVIHNRSNIIFIIFYLIFKFFKFFDRITLELS